MPDPCFIALTGIPAYQRVTAVGDVRRIEIDVTNLEGEPTAPEELTVSYLNGTGEETTTLVLGTDAALVAREIEKVDIGRYYVDLTLANPGTWAIRAEAGGDLVAAVEATFHVPSSLFE